MAVQKHSILAATVVLLLAIKMASSQPAPGKSNPESLTYLSSLTLTFNLPLPSAPFSGPRTSPFRHSLPPLHQRLDNRLQVSILKLASSSPCFQKALSLDYSEKNPTRSTPGSICGRKALQKKMATGEKKGGKTRRKVGMVNESLSVARQIRALVAHKCVKILAGVLRVENVVEIAKSQPLFFDTLCPLRLPSAMVPPPRLPSAMVPPPPPSLWITTSKILAKLGGFHFPEIWFSSSSWSLTFNLKGF
ncbi:hypothetical protein SLEP1_g48351 [Rubroshorea leprosula]|uniref:Uncharacterized protein n=1 Tax=Rubroshorea leprosula TaxID=152421 RepID=A0AAV5LW77_9ROSI|nr:hypothetical protein SLEP1_g48351 [Rubroshorea leprosula]